MSKGREKKEKTEDLIGVNKTNQGYKEGYKESREERKKAGSALSAAVSAASAATQCWKDAGVASCGWRRDDARVAGGGPR